MAEKDDDTPDDQTTGTDDDAKKGDKDVVPKSQFLAALNSAEQKRERELAALRTEFEDKLAKATKPAEKPQSYTRAQLNAAVAASQITQDAADELWDKQVRAEARAEATAVSTEIVTRAQRKDRVDSDIAQYTALDPDILVDGSAVRNKIAREYKFLVSLGDKPSGETELKAIRAALGPIEQLRLAKSGRTQHETHRETGGGSGGGRGANGKTLYDKLDTGKKEHYQKMIKAGQYKDVAEVEAELKWAAGKGRAA